MRSIYSDLRKLFFFIYNIFLSIYYYKTIRVFLNNHITRGIKYLAVRNTKFPHPIGIVIGKRVELGIDCTIYQNVTIGTKDTDNYKFSKYPVIEDKVIIYPNSIIIGDIKIGEGAIVGAGSIVLKDVEPYTVVAGCPAKNIKRL